MADPSPTPAKDEPRSAKDAGHSHRWNSLLEAARCVQLAQALALVAPTKSSAEDEAEPDDLSPVEVGNGLFFRLATPAMMTQHFENNAQMWASPLSKENYLQLKRRLAITDANIHDTQYWVLVHENDPGKVISSCTVHFRDAMINVGKGMQSVRAAIITDIFTIPEQRRVSMAAALLEEVQLSLDERKQRVEFSIIWSDNRPEFFEELGWAAQPANTLRIRLPKGAPIELPPETTQLQYAGVSDMDRIVLRDVKMTKCRFTHMRDRKKTFAQLIPTHELLRAHVVRAKAMDEFLTGADPVPDEIDGLGASWKSAVDRTEVWAWWTPDYRSRRLFIARFITLRLSGMEHAMKELLKVAAAAASRLQFRELIMWEPTDQVTKAASLLVDELPEGAKMFVEERTDMIPCLRWHGGEKRPCVLIEPEYYGYA